MKQTVLTVAIIHSFLLLSACAPNRPPALVAHKPDFERGMHVYQAHCSECHETGVRGAPTLDDVEDWDERSLQWQALMKDHATKGFMGMPAKGGNPELSKRDIADALYYMEIKVRANEE